MSSRPSVQKGDPAKLIPLSDLAFDPENPRLPKELDGSDEAAVLDWMIKYGAINELMASIGMQGFFTAEALLAVPNPSGGYWVVEGNRRLAAAKLLVNPNLARSRANSIRDTVAAADHAPTRLPVIVYPDRSKILAYLGFRHITGVKQWDSLAKARYLEQMRVQMTNDGVQEADMNRNLAKLIGSRSDYVERLLFGLKVYDRIVEEVLTDSEVKVDESEINFSVLTTALNYTSIADFVGLNREQGVEGVSRERLRELTQWTFEKSKDRPSRVGESRNLALLAQVVAEADALQVFRDGAPLKEAAVYAKGPGKLMRESLSAARNNLRAAFGAVLTVPDLNESDRARAEEVSTASNRLLKLIESVLLDAANKQDGGHE